MAAARRTVFRGLWERFQPVDGYIDVGRAFGIPIRMHWAAPLGLLLWSSPNGFHFAPGAYAGIALVILIHELGHAFVMRMCRVAVERIDFTIIGGECRGSAGHVDPMQHALIAWGGVLAQFVLLVTVAASWPFLPFTRTQAGGDFVHALIVSNFFIAIVNLLPFRGFDGAQAWKIVSLTLTNLLWGGRWVPPGAPFPKDLDADYLPPLPPEVRMQLDEITKGVGDERSMKEKG